MDDTDTATYDNEDPNSTDTSAYIPTRRTTVNGRPISDPNFEFSDGDQVCIDGREYTARAKGNGLYTMVPFGEEPVDPTPPRPKPSSLKKRLARAQRKKMKKHRKRNR